MNKPLSPEELACQLCRPFGKNAVGIGEDMFLSNSNMIFKTVDSLQIRPKSSVLEIGFGNGKHLSYLFEKNQNLHYTGIDHSEKMVEEAIKNNIELVEQKSAVFSLVKTDEKPAFGNNFFDYCFTVNTIYFFKNPQQYFEYIHSYLKPNGKLAIGFIDKHFAEKMSFTQKLFRLYRSETIEKWFSEIGFKSIETFNFSEKTISKDAKKVTRPFSVIVAEK